MHNSSPSLHLHLKVYYPKVNKWLTETNFVNISFLKMHGLGNDFIIIDQRQKEYNLSKEQIEKLCDRNIGIGCDQLILLRNSDICEAKMLIYNADGSSSGACGNATRCIAKIIDKPKSEIQVEDRMLEVSKKGNKISVNMGKAHFEWDKIPLIHDFEVLYIPFEVENFEIGACVNVGNPHLVFFVDDIENIDVLNYGPHFENHEYFPERVNVNFAQVMDRNNIKLATWERGSGATLACGSGACATQIIAYKLDLVDSKAKVHLKAGQLEIETTDNDEIIMTGPAEEVFKGEVVI